MTRAEDEFIVFFRDQYARLIAFLCKAGFTRDKANDAAQDAMTMALRKWDTLTNPAAWVRTVAYRLAVREAIRERQRSSRTPEQDWDIADRNGTEPFDAFETRMNILQLLKGFPEQQRLVLAWHLDGYTNIEIAEQLRMRPSTVRSHLRHALARLRAKAKEELGGVAK